jgi:hypothetical protein
MYLERRTLYLIAMALTLESLPGFAHAEDPISRPADPGQRLERTCFQTHARWDGKIQLRSDVAVCYGIDASLPERIAQWKAQGYVVHLMTGVSWGQYQDYLYGRFDGVRHLDEAQKDRYGRVISHGGDVYYMSPGENYGKFLCQGVKRAIDAGAEAVHLEEPEFWVRGGYSEGFKREWKAHYGEDWVAPHSSPDAQYRASQLKYFLYGRALKQVFDFVKAENVRTGRKVKCYVPTHSLINYAHWQIVSPESSLIKVGADGFIAQVWTGTARTPNVYRGQTKERTFEAAFFEYGAMMNVVQASGGTVWFLNDPIEDNPNHSWTDYKTNWESTLTASLLWPQVWRYEVMPWPERIFRGRYPAVERAQRKSWERVERIPITTAYGTELMTVINALNDMDQKEISWDCGTRGIGVVVSDTMMFQRGQPTPSDKNLGSFYGLALPLLKHGMPAEPVQLENATTPGALAPHKVLLMTYEGMKPMAPDVHDALADWVKQGGSLVFLGDDSDPFNAVRAWWNDPKAARTYKAPRAHLFERLGLPADVAPGLHKVGKGSVVYDTAGPASLTYRTDGADFLLALVKRACESVGLTYSQTNHLTFRRGPYVIAAGLDESIGGPYAVLKGRFLDLFDAALPSVDLVTLKPGSRRFLLDLDKVPGPGPIVLASAFKVLGMKVETKGGSSFHAEGPDGIEAVVCLRLPGAPRSVTVDRQPLPDAARAWEPATRLLRLKFPNKSAGCRVEIRPE